MRLVCAIIVSTDAAKPGENPQQPFCKPGDPDSLVALLQTVLHNPDLRRELGVRNRKRALTEFSVDVMCKKTVGIIADILNGRSN